MSTRAGGPSGQGGFTLVEMLLAVAILGVGVLTLVGGMMTSIHVSDLERRQADGQAALRAYAEAVANDTYTDCTASYPAAGFTAPAGFTVTQTVAYWQPASASFSGTCPAPDAGLQRITLTVLATDGRAVESVRIAKRQRPAGEP